MAVRVVLAGAGRIGRSHLGHLVKLHEEGEIELKYIIEPFPAAREAVKAVVPSSVQIVASFEDVPDSANIQGVYICTPTDCHKANITTAAQRKWHIFCEKPLGFSREEIRQCFEETVKHKVMLQAGWNRRYDPESCRLVKLFEHDKPLTVNLVARDYPVPPDDALIRLGHLIDDFCIHDINMALWLMDGEVPEYVYAFGSRTHGTSVVDFGHLILEFKGGRVVHIEGSRFSPNGFEFRMEAVGKKEVYNSVFEGPNPDSFIKRWQPAYYSELKAFATAIRTNKIVLGDFQDNVATNLVAEALNRSFYAKRRVPVVPPTSSKLKLRALGQGAFGTYMTKLAEQSGKFEISGAPAKASTGPSVEEVVNDPNTEAIYVCTPDRLHNPHTIQAMRKGKHVFCEKPLLGFPEASLAASSIGVQLMLDFQRRYDDSFIQAQTFLHTVLPHTKKIVIESRDPVPYSVNGSNKDYVLHVLENSVIHDLDMAQWLLQDQGFTLRITGVEVQNKKYSDLHVHLVAQSASFSFPVEIHYSKEHSHYVQNVQISYDENGQSHTKKFGDDLSADFNGKFFVRYETAYLRVWSAFHDLITTGGPTPKGYQTTFQLLSDVQALVTKRPDTDFA